MRTAPTLEIATGTNPAYQAFRTSNADGVKTNNISTATPDGGCFKTQQKLVLVQRVLVI